nr:lysine--tRNA ligase [Nitrosopumilus sp.]
AFTIIEREKKLGRSIKVINVESGLGASGIPHIGSMGDAVRAFGISLALQNIGYRSELIAFSDDLDGLRKVPAGLPDWLNEYLCIPVSSIPDPFGDCHESYGMHMSSLLLDGLEKVGVNYKFKSGTDVYKSGELTNQIHNILINSKIIGDKIANITGQQKYIKFLPFFPICQQCGRLYVANATEYFPDERKLSYSCIGNTINKKQINGCGHQGEVKIENGGGKLAGKVEFAARWNAFDIRFEAFGKDIMDSVRINDWVASEILKFHHPLHIKYEMFLDKGGKKISKSSGNVLTPQMWLKYGTPQSLMLLLYKRISGTRHVSIDDIPILMDEYDLYEDIYFDKIKETNKNKSIKFKGIYEYINNLIPPQKPQIHVPYRILIQQSELFIDLKINSIKKIYERLEKYGLINEENPLLTNKINLAMKWAREFREVYDDNVDNDAKNDGGINILLEKNQKKAINEVLSQLNTIADELEKSDPSQPLDFNDKNNGKKQGEEGEKEDHGEEDLNQKIQTIIYTKSKENNILPKDFFKLFYKILINAERGPRLGNYIVDLGIKNVVNKIGNKIK